MLHFLSITPTTIYAYLSIAVILILSISGSLISHAFYNPIFFKSSSFKIHERFLHKLSSKYQQDIIEPYKIVFTCKMISTACFILTIFKMYMLYLIHAGTVYVAVSIIFLTDIFADWIIYQQGYLPFIGIATYPFMLTLFIFSPLIFMIIFMLDFLLPNINKKNGLISKLSAFISYAEHTNIIKQTDKMWLESILYMRNIEASECMTPIHNVKLWDINLPIKKALKSIHNLTFSNIPVYENSMNNIIGLLNYREVANNFVFGKNARTLKSLSNILSPALFIPETKKIYALFHDLKHYKYKIAIVVNEYGVMEGVITLSDIIEVIIGNMNFYSMTSNTAPTHYYPHPDGGWIINANISLNELASRLNIYLPKNVAYDRLGGFILHHTDTIPQTGYVFTYANYIFEILRVTTTSIKSVKVSKA